jgi:hypothetical protein
MCIYIFIYIYCIHHFLDSAFFGNESAFLADKNLCASKKFFGNVKASLVRQNVFGKEKKR